MTDAVTRICPDCRVQLDGGTGDEGHACPAAPRPGPGLLGAVLDDRYEVRAHLGEGGMGVVYKARHVLLNKPVALKVLRQAHSDAARHRFMREAQAAAAIRHSSIVDITDFGVIPDGRTYLVMEYLEGQTLAAALADGLVDLRRGLRIAVQIARGLGAVHDCGVVHRDLKPDNIFLVEREGERDLVKIVDFGIAKLREAQRLTDEGMVVGTAEYMSPEQATGQDVDARSDQYSLGCILYEVVTGELPFPGKTIAAVMHRHVYEEVEPPRRRAPARDIPPSLEALILRTLHKDPARRYPSMLALALALQHELDLIEGTGDPVTRAALRAGPAPRWWRRPAVLGPLGATVLGALLGLVAVPPLLAPRPAAAPAPAASTRSASPAAPPTAAPPGPAQTPASGAAGPAQAGARGLDAAPTATPFAPRPPAAATAERTAPPSSPSAPLRLTLVITQPVDTPVSVSCGGRPRPCQGSCAVVVEPGARCEVRAPGFQPRPLRHGELSRQARDGRVTQRVALTPIRL